MADTDVKTSSNALAAEVPAPRGRPGRKAAEAASSAMKELANNSNSHNNDGEPKAKRGRGRPRKNPADVKPKPVSTPGAKKAGRGRPRKTPKPAVSSGTEDSPSASGNE